MPTEKIAYLAGYFEGEGSIFFTKSKSPMLYIAMSTGDKTILNEFVHYFGGNLLPVKPYKRKAKRAIYRWQQGGSAAQETLRKLSPFFRIKQTQAFLALTLNINERGLKTTELEKELRERVAAQVTAINNRVTVNG